MATSVIKLTNFPPTLPNVPPNYPVGAAPGKIQLLLESNDNYLYHKFSPYTNYKEGVLSGILSNKQPFVYTFVDEAGDGLISGLPTAAKGVLGVLNINQSSANDVVRVSKFMISSWGIMFLVKQLAIQRSAPFDETRLYNPLSPILATVGFGGLLNRPMRHIEGGLLGLANSITSTIGINLQSGFQTPKSTVGDQALPDTNIGQGKGLIRGGHANSGIASFQSKWSPATAPNKISLSNIVRGFTKSVTNTITSFFGGAPKSPGVFRADEEGYKLMAQGSNDLQQPWFAAIENKLWSDTPINKSTFGIVQAKPATNKESFQKQRLYSDPDGFVWKDTTKGVVGPKINGKPTGYDVGQKYTDVIGQQPISDETSLKNSDMLVQYGYYVDDAKNFPTKFVDKDKARKLQDGLQEIVNKINSTNLYSVIQSPSSFLLPSKGFGNLYSKYDNWTEKSKQTIDKTHTSGEYNTFRNHPKKLDVSISDVAKDSLRMATSFASDGINTLGVLGKDRLIDSTNSSVSKNYTGWTEWKPYEDDLIAFFFYDVVNDKYIPFRATVKAISEGNTAFWDELRFIGRADQLYSYNGFSRTLSFTFNVVINSVSELLPSWKKINYMASAVKPSNYTTGQNIYQSFNRFIVPPMFMLTIGDLYKFQPIVITSLNVNIPEDASWETLNEDNSRNWSYLNGLITSPNLGKNYGQLPREVEISVTCNLLEKERAVVGGSHFGHEPRVDNWGEFSNTNDRFLTGSVSYLPVPTTLHQGFIEWNDPGSPTQVKQREIYGPTIPAGQSPTPTQASTPSSKLLLSPTTAGNILSGNPPLQAAQIKTSFVPGGGSFGGGGAGGLF